MDKACYINFLIGTRERVTTDLTYLSLRWFEANVHGAVPNEFSVPMFGLAKKCWRRCRTRGESGDQEEER